MLGNVAASNYNPKSGDDLANFINSGPQDGTSFLPMWWYDFTDLNNLFQAQNGTSQVTTNDQYIRQVKNKFNNFPYWSNDWTGNLSTIPLVSGKWMISLADNDTTAPQFKTNVHNGLSAAYFDGDAGLYASGGSMAEGAMLEEAGCSFCGMSTNTNFNALYLNVWIVFKGTGNVTSDETMFSAVGTSNGLSCATSTKTFLEFKLEESDDDYEYIGGQEGGATTTNATNINATTDVELWTICGRNEGAGTGRVYRNGDTSDGIDGQTMAGDLIYQMGVFTGPGVSSCQNQSLGCKVDSSKAFSQHWTGHVFEYLAIEGVITDVTRTGIDNYFKSKYNIS